MHRGLVQSSLTLCDQSWSQLAPPRPSTHLVRRLLNCLVCKGRIPKAVCSTGCPVLYSRRLLGRSPGKSPHKNFATGTHSCSLCAKRLPWQACLCSWWVTSRAYWQLIKRLQQLACTDAVEITSCSASRSLQPNNQLD